MAYFIGTDEAGYGPNLGPLIVTATAWRAPDDLKPDALYELLGDYVCRKRKDNGDCRLAIARFARIPHR